MPASSKRKVVNSSKSRKTTQARWVYFFDILLIVDSNYMFLVALLLVLNQSSQMLLNSRRMKCECVKYFYKLKVWTYICYLVLKSLQMRTSSWKIKWRIRNYCHLCVFIFAPIICLFSFRFVDDGHESVDEDEEMDEPKTPSSKKYWFLWSFKTFCFADFTLIQRFQKGIAKSYPWLVCVKLICYFIVQY